MQGQNQIKRQNQNENEMNQFIKDNKERLINIRQNATVGMIIVATQLRKLPGQRSTKGARGERPLFHLALHPMGFIQRFFPSHVREIQQLLHAKQIPLLIIQNTYRNYKISPHPDNLLRLLK